MRRSVLTIYLMLCAVVAAGPPAMSAGIVDVSSGTMPGIAVVQVDIAAGDGTPDSVFLLQNYRVVVPKDVFDSLGLHLAGRDSGSNCSVWLDLGDLVAGPERAAMRVWLPADSR